MKFPLNLPTTSKCRIETARTPRKQTRLSASFCIVATLASISIPRDAVANDAGTNVDRPNVVVILADDLGIVDINAYASRFTNVDSSRMFYETPNLDRLVREGTAFSQAYACHLCSPARASLLTGKYAARTGFTTAVGGNVKTFYNQGLQPPDGYVAQDAIEWKDKIDIQQALLNGTTRDALASGHPSDQGQDEITLAEAMHGHDSAFIGKWHLGGHGSNGWQPQDQGFEEIAYFDEGGSPYFNWRKLWDRRDLGNSQMPQAQLLKGRSGTNHGQTYLTDELTEHAVAYINERGKLRGNAKPFFLYLCHFAVHTPFQAVRDDVDYFENKSTRGWNQHENAVYAAMLRRLDASVGRILDTLASTGLDEETLVVFISDNGGVTYTSPVATCNAPFKGGKALHFEGGIRVPLVVRWTGRVAGGEWSDVPVDCNDIFPTVLDLAGYEVATHVNESSIDGRSLVPLLTDRSNSEGQYPRDTFFWHYPLNVIVVNPDDGLPSAPSSAIRKGDWKLIFDWSGRLRLYNIASDPFEKDNLADSEREKALALFRELNDWIDANVDVKYTPAMNPDYVPSKEARSRPFVDLRRELLGEDRAIRTVDTDPRFEVLSSRKP